MLFIRSKVLPRTVHGIIAKVFQLTNDVLRVVKDNSVHAKRLSSQNVFHFIIDKNSLSRIKTCIVNDVLVEADIRFPFASLRPERRVSICKLKYRTIVLTM